MKRTKREQHAIKNLNHIDISAEREGRAIKRLAEIAPKTCEYRSPKPDEPGDAGHYHNAHRYREDATMDAGLEPCWT